MEKHKKEKLIQAAEKLAIDLGAKQDLKKAIKDRKKSEKSKPNNG